MHFLSHCTDERIPEASLIFLNQLLIFLRVKIGMGIVKWQKPHSLVSGIFFVKSYERVPLEVWLSYRSMSLLP